VSVSGQALNCAHSPQGATLADAIAAACPAPLTKVGEALGAQVLEEAFHRWGLDAPPRLEIPTEAGEASVDDPLLAAIGQETLTVTPLHVALAAAAIGNDGVKPALRLTLETEGVDGEWHQTEPPDDSIQVISPDLAESLRDVLRSSDDGFVRGHGSLALAGADRPPHVWYIGLAPAQAPRHAVVVLLEHGGTEGLDLAERIGHDALVAAGSLVP
jgi:peptidoglycan glycosyltransferase